MPLSKGTKIAIFTVGGLMVVGAVAAGGVIIYERTKKTNEIKMHVAAEKGKEKIDSVSGKECVVIGSSLVAQDGWLEIPTKTMVTWDIGIKTAPNVGSIEFKYKPTFNGTPRSVDPTTGGITMFRIGSSDKFLQLFQSGYADGDFVLFGTILKEPYSNFFGKWSAKKDTVYKFSVEWDKNKNIAALYIDDKLLGSGSIDLSNFTNMSEFAFVANDLLATRFSDIIIRSANTHPISSP